jgi:cytochrome b6-f complex iron-sulfur subunit
MPEEPLSPSRRNWLLGCLTTSITATMAAVFYPVLRFLWPRAATVSGAMEIVAPFHVGQLPTVQGNPFNFGGKPCLVVLTADGAKRRDRGEALRADDVRAFNAICTHTDCTVQYRPDQDNIFCACHDGAYDLNGMNISGPPPRPLEVYKVRLRGEPGQEEIIVGHTA